MIKTALEDLRRLEETKEFELKLTRLIRPLGNTLSTQAITVNSKDINTDSITGRVT